MKTYCKNIDISDPETIAPFILDAFSGKWARHEYAALLVKYGGMTYREIREDMAAQDMTRRLAAIDQLAVEVAGRIKNKHLGLEPMRTHYKTDGLSGKTRELVKEGAMQQLLDYVAVDALMPMLMAKITPHQVASVRGRGQTYGKRVLERWIRRDKHSRHVRKGDIKKCYAHITRPTIMRLLNRDIHKNKLLLWLVDALLKMHEAVVAGLAIGSYLSAWLCNYALSYLARFIAGLTRSRCRKNGTVTTVRLVRHVLFYADDFVIIGARAADVEKAMRLAKEYALNVLGLELHKNWQRIDLKYGNVDMMGYVIGYKHTTIRRRIYRRLRRQYMRARRELKSLGYVPHWRARKICSYKGYFDHTDTWTGATRLDAWNINRAAALSISYADAKKVKELMAA